MRALLAAPLALVSLIGCASDPQAQLRNDAAAVIAAANSRDADAVRARAADLERTVEELAADGALTEEQADRLAALAESLGSSADLIDETLLEQRRQEAETEAERKRLEEEAARLEEERRRLEDERKEAEEERGKDEEERKKDEDDKDEHDKDEHDKDEHEVDVGEQGG